jgi:hypothetical protein
VKIRVILSRLGGVRHSGDGWIARCPAHGDHNPSLSVRETVGKILVHCHAGCTVEAVCAALGIHLRDLFETPQASSRPEPPMVRAVERQIKGLRSRLTPRERVLPVTVVLATPETLDRAMARGLALAVEGEVVQVVLKEGAE